MRRQTKMLKELSFSLSYFGTKLRKNILLASNLGLFKEPFCTWHGKSSFGFGTISDILQISLYCPCYCSTIIHLSLTEGFWQKEKQFCRNESIVIYQFLNLETLYCGIMSSENNGRGALVSYLSRFCCLWYSCCSNACLELEERRQ